MSEEKKSAELETYGDAENAIRQAWPCERKDEPRKMKVELPRRSGKSQACASFAKSCALPTMIVVEEKDVKEMKRLLGDVSGEHRVPVLDVRCLTETRCSVLRNTVIVFDEVTTAIDEAAMRCLYKNRNGLIFVSTATGPDYQTLPEDGKAPRAGTPECKALVLEYLRKMKDARGRTMKSILKALRVLQKQNHAHFRMPPAELSKYRKLQIAKEQHPFYWVYRNGCFNKAEWDENPDVLDMNQKGFMFYDPRIYSKSI